MNPHTTTPAALMTPRSMSVASRLLIGRAFAWGDRTFSATRSHSRAADSSGSPCGSGKSGDDEHHGQARGSSTEKRRTVTLVYPDDIDLASDGVSILEPLGTALLGARVGDVIQCPAEKVGRLRIVEILYQPEHLGAFHL